LLEAANAWPESTTEGEPSLVPGSLEVIGDSDGSVLFSFAVGSARAPANEASYVEYVLSPAQADALVQALASRR
jgi:hypothetical protein